MCLDITKCPRGPGGGRTTDLASQDEDGDLFSEQQQQKIPRVKQKQDFKVNLLFIFKMFGQWVERARGISFQNLRWELDSDKLNKG